MSTIWCDEARAAPDSCFASWRKASYLVESGDLRRLRSGLITVGGNMAMKGARATDTIGRRRLLGGGLAAGALAGVGLRLQRARADSPVALTLAVWGAQTEEDAFKSVIDKYQALHPNVTIRLEMNGNSMQSCVRQVQQFGHGDWVVSVEPLVSRGRSRAVGRSSAAPQGRARQLLAASRPASILRDWPGGCPARRGIRPAD
jgi:hypothetical protein